MENEHKYIIVGIVLILTLIVATIFYLPRNDDSREEEKTYCQEEQRNVDACTQEYNPVCGHRNDSSTKTYSNSCHACMNSEVEYYTPGEC